MAGSGSEFQVFISTLPMGKLFFGPKRRRRGKCTFTSAFSSPLFEASKVSAFHLFMPPWPGPFSFPLPSSSLPLTGCAFPHFPFLDAKRKRQHVASCAKCNFPLLNPVFQNFFPKCKGSQLEQTTSKTKQNPSWDKQNEIKQNRQSFPENIRRSLRK